MINMVFILDSEKNTRIYSGLKFGKTEARTHGQGLSFYSVSKEIFGKTLRAPKQEYRYPMLFWCNVC